MRKTASFLLALWKANLLSTMEYRVAFFTQVIGMMLNNGVYFLFWVIFFDRFKEIRGWQLSDMFLLFGIVATGFGMSVFLFGNILNLADLIAQGSLDYYLALPKPVLLHVLASRCVASGLGDFSYGLLSFLLARQLTLDAFGRYLLGAGLSASVFLSFLILVQSLAFYIGNAQMISGQALNAMITFSIYPINLFDGTAKLLLFTLIPAVFVGAFPAQYVRSASWQTLLTLLGVAALITTLAVTAFYHGLKRYESGSAIQTQV